MMLLPTVKAFAAALLERTDLPINILVNNAGVADMKKTYAAGHIGGITQVSGEDVMGGSWPAVYHRPEVTSDGVQVEQRWQCPDCHSYCKYRDTPRVLV